MERAALRQSGFVAPCAKLAAELGRRERLTRDLHEKGQMLVLCGVNDCLQLRSHRQRQQCASFILANCQHPILDMLTPHADHVTEPLHGMKTERKAKTRLRPDRMT